MPSETKPSADLPPKGFFSSAALRAKPMEKNPRLGYVGWLGVSSGVISVG